METHTQGMCLYLEGAVPGTGVGWMSDDERLIATHAGGVLFDIDLNCAKWDEIPQNRMNNCTFGAPFRGESI